jgi:ABC-type Co2+ transport system permease subunit
MLYVIPQTLGTPVSRMNIPKSWIVIAGIGGVVRFLSSNMRDKKPMRPVSFLLALLANCIISGFAGPMTALYVSTMTDDKTWPVIAAGIGGYLGIEMLNLISAIFKSIFFKSSE